VFLFLPCLLFGRHFDQNHGAEWTERSGIVGFSIKVTRFLNQSDWLIGLANLRKKTRVLLTGRQVSVQCGEKYFALFSMTGQASRGIMN
jgi:hypothetical protein